MQVTGSLISAQQFGIQPGVQSPPAAAKGPASFAAALENNAGFAPLPLKQTAASTVPARAEPQAPAARPGSMIDIRI